MRTVKIFLALSCVMLPFLFPAGNVYSQWEENLTEPEEKKVIVETVYKYYVRNYSPPYQVRKVVNPGQADYSSPESTVIAHISAMQALDWDWFMSIWTKESREIIRKTNREMGITPEDTLSVWKRNVAGAVPELLTRVDRGEYVIIEYQLKFNEKGKRKNKSTVVLWKEGGRWRTAHLIGDPVHGYWGKKQKEYRIKRVEVDTPRPGKGKNK